MSIYQYLAAYSLYGIVWSGYTISVMLSSGDGMLVKALLFIILFYFTYRIGQYVVKTRRLAVITALSGAGIYMLAKYAFQWYLF